MAITRDFECSSNARKSDLERNDLSSLLAQLLGGLHHGTPILNGSPSTGTWRNGGTISFGVQFLGPKRRPPHDILCSRRHQMTSGEELVVKSRKAVGVAVAMQI